MFGQCQEFFYPVLSISFCVEVFGAVIVDEFKCIFVLLFFEWDEFLVFFLQTPGLVFLYLEIKIFDGYNSHADLIFSEA